MTTLTTNMAALESGCKPRLRAKTKGRFTPLLYLGTDHFGSIKIQSWLQG